MTSTHAERVELGWIPDDSTFGARLALVRQKMAWGNVKEAAIECGLPPESWRTWERDGVTPRNVLEIAAVIADRTGCDYAWLTKPPSRATKPVRLPNARSVRRANRPRRHAKSTIAERISRQLHTTGRTQTSSIGPSPAGPPSQRRPSLIGPPK